MWVKWATRRLTLTYDLVFGCFSLSLSSKLMSLFNFQHRFFFPIILHFRKGYNGCVCVFPIFWQYTVMVWHEIDWELNIICSMLLNGMARTIDDLYENSKRKKMKAKKTSSILRWWNICIILNANNDSNCSISVCAAIFLVVAGPSFSPLKTVQKFCSN